MMMVDYTTTDTSKSTGLSERGYSGSSLAGMLVTVLFLIWFLRRMGMIDC